MSAKLMQQAMLCETQKQANALLEELTAEIIMESPALNAQVAEHAARQRIGYYAGHASHATRDRVERLFKTAHPIFGAIRYNGPPSAAQVAQLGIEFGEATREAALGSNKARDAWIAVGEIPRVDPRRVPCERPTGIMTRALDIEGHYAECDIATLTCDALIRYLRARGGRNVFAEATVLQILGHELPEHMLLVPRPK